jgi:hypothetical protein
MKKLGYIRDLLESHGIRMSGAPAKKLADFQNRLDFLLRMRADIYMPDVKGYKPDAELCFRKKRT